MAAPRLAGRARRRLIALLRDDRSDPRRLLQRVLEFGRLEELPVCSEALNLLAHLDLPESRAEVVLADVLEHRCGLAEALGRDPGTVVAAADYLSNVERLLQSFELVEMAELESAERWAVTDRLTGLENQRRLDAAVRGEVRRSRRQRAVFSLLVLELDRPAAPLLPRVASILRRVSREADSAFRRGGSGFAVLLSGTARAGALALAQRFRGQLRRERLPVTVAGGIASFPEDGDDAAGVIARADRTLRQARSGGGDRICLHPLERRRLHGDARRHYVSPRDAREDA